MGAYEQALEAPVLRAEVEDEERMRQLADRINAARRGDQ